MEKKENKYKTINYETKRKRSRKEIKKIIINKTKKKYMTKTTKE